MLKHIFRWLSGLRPVNPGSYTPIDTKGIRDEDLQKAANSPLGQEVIRRFLAMSPYNQRKALAALNWQQSYRVRRMLGPEWTKKEDEASEAARKEIWPALKAYIESHPEGDGRHAYTGNDFNLSTDDNVESGK